MNKKLITAFLALVALAAFALPATASASPEITDPINTRLNPETGECTGVKKTVCIRAHLLENTVSNFTSTSGTVLVECNAATMTGYLTKNNGTEIEGSIHSTSFSGTAAEGKCTGLGGVKVTTNVGNGTPWCIRATNAMNSNEFQVRGGECSAAARSITFQMDTGLGVNCRYERGATSPVRGTFTTASTGDAILTVTGAGTTGGEDSEFTKEVGDSVLCPANGTLDMTFTLETDKTASTEPIYIS